MIAEYKNHFKPSLGKSYHEKVGLCNTKIMRKIFFLCTLALLQCTIAIAQNQGGGNGPKDGQMKLQPFNAKNAIGLINYDADEVCEASKIKDEETCQLVAKAIAEYNYDIKEFNFQNALKLSDIELMVNAKQTEAIEKQNFEGLKETQIKTKELLMPYKDLIDEANAKLNEKLKKVLSEKEFKRWSKYSDKKKEALHPKAPSKPNENAMQPGGMSGNQRGGLNGGQQRRY